MIRLLIAVSGIAVLTWIFHGVKMKVRK